MSEEQPRPPEIPRALRVLGALFIHLAGGCFLGAGIGWFVFGFTLMLRGEDTGAALGAMLIGAPLGGLAGMVLGFLWWIVPKPERWRRWSSKLFGPGTK